MVVYVDDIKKEKFKVKDMKSGDEKMLDEKGIIGLF